jgi:hypothetical protein
MKKLLGILGALLLVAGVGSAQTLPGVSGNPSVLSRPGGIFYAPAFLWQGHVITGNTATGSATIQVAGATGGIGGFTLPDGTVFDPSIISATLSPIIVDYGQTNQETVTPTAMSVGTCSPGNLGIGGTVVCLSITASFSNTHGQNAVVIDGAFGAQTAANMAQRYGGGTVVIDAAWAQLGGTNATLTAMIPYQLVSILDNRFGLSQPWVTSQTISTILAAPTTLTSTTVGFGINGANTTGGTYTGTSTYHYCIAYVDIMGNEGPCSADFSAATAGTGTTNQIGVKAPAASTGAVGYTVYISLAAGSYNLTYQAPLTTTTCNLTLLETVTPACAVTNANYNQTGSNAAISALTVNTAPLHLLKTTASTTAAYIGTPSGRTTYAYAPQNTFTQGLTASQQAYTISTAPATTVPTVIATIPVPIGTMNFLGRQLCVELQATEASNGSTATIQNFELLWDAAGSDTTGAPVIVGQVQLTATLVTANADNWSFHECIETTTSGATVTAGAVQPLGGQLISTFGAGSLGNAGTEVNVAPVGSLNLAGTGGNTQRLHVVWVHTTGTDANGVTVTGLRTWFQ